ncbi:MAG: DNA-binding protein [Methylococcales bacterium]|nr:DNA-binding protein [Methylococcales bacterium]
MNAIIVNEQQLLIEIEKLRSEFTETQDLYREVCVLLFFRYGITPTANKLYQYVRRGSMSAPADALNKFWSELREKSRVRIDRSDIPESIGLATGDFVATLWNEAQKAAQLGFTDLVENATAEILKSKLDAELARQDATKLKVQLDECNLDLKSTQKRLSETDNLLLVNTNTLAMQEKALKSLRIECDNLSTALSDEKATFSRDLNLINASLQKAEDRFRSLENKSLLEVDQARQLIKRLEKEIISLRKITKDDQSSHTKDQIKNQNIIAALNERVGTLNGKLIEISKQLSKTSRKLAQAEKKINLKKTSDIKRDLELN